MRTATAPTREHVYLVFENPWFSCDHCGNRVRSWHQQQDCGCASDGCYNLPCGHRSDITSICATWVPGRGCTCATPHWFAGTR